MHLSCMLTLIAWGWLATSLAHAAEVRVFTDEQHPVKARAGVKIIRLDAPARLHAQLARQLPADPKRAAVILRQRIAAGGATLRQQLTRAYQDVIDAQRMGISKIPAVMVDRKYVVYGEPDIDRALSYIEQHRRRAP
jgi:integrating conjugative element protein (TIGR03757 family)